jgi:hypothetical protein
VERTPLVVFEPDISAARMTPTAPLGPWALGSLARLLAATERGCTATLDLRDHPITAPTHVAAVLWAEDTAKDLGVALEVLVADDVSAELLEFAGIQATVYTAAEVPAPDEVVRRASAY